MKQKLRKMYQKDLQIENILNNLITKLRIWIKKP